MFYKKREHIAPSFFEYLITYVIYNLPLLCYTFRYEGYRMIKIEIDEKRLKNLSHIEIRERKGKIAVVEVPKGKTTAEIEIK